ncbi:MAG: hypothetical protein JXJ04_17800 [Spirochaetales bacterium]|nr:hypothetical protein [Spirochaetales bacterium]
MKSRIFITATSLWNSYLGCGRSLRNVISPQVIIFNPELASCLRAFLIHYIKKK